MNIVETMENLPLPVLDHWGYWVIFLAALLETTPLFGIIIPGQTLVLLGGFFVKLGKLEFAGVLFAASAGAILGDFTGYLLGRRYGHTFIVKYGKYVFFKEKHFQKVKSLLNQHTAKTLIIGRFNSLTRAFSPFVAGSSHVLLGRFLLCNVIGGFSWAVCYVLLGIIFGQSYQMASRYVGEFLLIAIALSLLLIYGYRLINKRKHLFSLHDMVILIINIGCLYVFAKMVEDVYNQEWIIHVDHWVNAKAAVILNPMMKQIMLFFTYVTNPVCFIVLSVLLFIILVRRKYWSLAWLLFSGMACGFFSDAAIKLIIHRPRPENAVVWVSGYSFPSGHAVIAIIFLALMLYAFTHKIRSRLFRDLFVFIDVGLILMSGVSRLYLNVHWFSDIMAGWSLGLFWVTLLILIFKTVPSMYQKSDLSFGMIMGGFKSLLKRPPRNKTEKAGDD